MSNPFTTLNSSRRSAAAPLNPFLNAAIGAGTALAVTAALLAIAAAVTGAGVLPETAMPVITLASAFVGAYCGCKSAAKRADSRKLFVSLGAAALLFVVLFAVGGAISGETSFGGTTLASLPVMLGSGVLAGVQPITKKLKKR
jgi:putative membrane protein (TIGR04086 family)